MLKYSCALICLFMATNLLAKDYKISSAAELAALKLSAGDKVILKDGEWKDQQLVFTGTGTEKNPIILTVEAPGKTKLTGTSTLFIEGTWLVADGLYFTEGYISKGDVIVFTKDASYCRVTNTAVVNFNPPDKKTDYRWVSLNGHHNRVDHCWLEGKTHQAPTLVVWLAEKPNYHRIDHNYFGPRPLLGGNGGETIRIGTSTWSFFDSFTTVEDNVFEHCDGELEIISNKSCKNILRNNLFYESKGTLTLRHGNDADVYGNYFIGNNIPETGGIRVICENHKVHDNYMQDLTGTNVSAAISVMDGLPNPILTSHWQVKNATITNNVIINCKESFNIGAGKNPERYLPALNSAFTNNIIVTNNKPLTWSDDQVKIRFADNRLWPATDSVPEGFSVSDPGLQKDPSGIYCTLKNWSAKPFWLNEKIGPLWRSAKYIWASH